MLNGEKPTAFFTELNLPLPKRNATMAGSTECVGGLWRMLGLGSRLVSAPLMAPMGVARINHTFLKKFLFHRAHRGPNRGHGVKHEWRLDKPRVKRKGAIIAGAWKRIRAAVGGAG